MILLGDVKNCALLKEAAIEFFTENAKSVKASSGWAKIRESTALMNELMDLAWTTNKCDFLLLFESSTRKASR
jgi:hypothetical protein